MFNKSGIFYDKSLVITRKICDKGIELFWNTIWKIKTHERRN